MSWLLYPATLLLGRLRYAQKIMLITVVLLLPLGFVAKAYVDIQSGQISFSAKERDGVAYLVPLADLTARTVTARQLAVTGHARSAAGVADGIGRVDRANATLGDELDTGSAWSAAKDLLAKADSVAGANEAFAAYNAAVAALLALIIRVSDESNLTLDPDLDTYYLMDALVFRLPLMLDTVGRVADQSVLAGGGDAVDADAARIDLATARGTLTTTLASTDAGMATSVAQTHSATLASRVGPEVRAMHDGVQALVGQITTALQTGDVSAITAEQAQIARTSVASLATTFGPVLDELLTLRISAFQSKAHQVELITLLAVLLVAYLLVGFYRSATLPLRRVVTALAFLAEGDLTKSVLVDTRDEVGQMAAALDLAITRIRESIDERHRLEVELRHAQKLESVGRLAAGIAHEINTPVQFIGDNVRFLESSFADLLRLREANHAVLNAATEPAALDAAVAAVRALEDDLDVEFIIEEVPGAIQQTLDGITRVATIVRAMKAFGYTGNEKAPADLNEAINNTLVVAASELKFVADVETDLGSLPPVRCHIGDINQVVLNLVVNAAHAVAAAGPERGTIQVSTRVEGEQVVIDVTDSGTGIPPDVADKVFEAFFTTKDIGTGTGQGLALCRSLIVDRHGGSIDFTTEPGTGTTFTVRLPFAADSDPAPDAGNAEMAAATI